MISREILRTGLTRAETERLLTEMIQSRSNALDPHDRCAPANDAQPFVGAIDGDRFKFHRIITGTRGFEVIVTGRIVDGPGGAELRIAIRVAIPVALFVIAWLGAIATLMSLVALDAVGIAVIAVAHAAILGQFFVQERGRTLQVLRQKFPRWVLSPDRVR